MPVPFNARGVAALAVGATVCSAAMAQPDGGGPPANYFRPLVAEAGAGVNGVGGVSGDGPYVLLSNFSLAFRYDVQSRTLLNIGPGWGHDISFDGSTIVGGADVGAITGGFVWTPDHGQRLLRNLPGFGDQDSVARAVSDDGQVIVGSLYGANQPFRWSEATGRINLQLFGQGNLSNVSGDGRFATGWTMPAGAVTGVRWAPSGAAQFLAPPGGAAEPLVASFDGSIIAGTEGGPIFLWREGQPLRHLGAFMGASFNLISDMTGAGDAFAGTSLVGNSLVPFIWEEGRGFSSLAGFLSGRHGLNLQGYTLEAVDGMSADGLTFVGRAHLGSGTVTAFVAHIPAPGAGSVALVVVLLTSRRVRRSPVLGA